MKVTSVQALCAGVLPSHALSTAHAVDIGGQGPALDNTSYCATWGTPQQAGWRLTDTGPWLIFP